MSARLMRLVAAIELPSVRGVRLPVTVTGCSSKDLSCAMAGARTDDEETTASSSGRAAEINGFMGIGQMKVPSPASPRARAIRRRTWVHHHLLAGIRAGGATLATFPEVNHLQWCVHKSGSLEGFVRRTVAGAAQFRDKSLLLPV